MTRNLTLYSDFVLVACSILVFPPTCSGFLCLSWRLPSRRCFLTGMPLTLNAPASSLANISHPLFNLHLFFCPIMSTCHSPSTYHASVLANIAWIVLNLPPFIFLSTSLCEDGCEPPYTSSIPRISIASNLVSHVATYLDRFRLRLARTTTPTPQRSLPQTGVPLTYSIQRCSLKTPQSFTCYQLRCLFPFPIHLDNDILSLCFVCGRASL